MGQRPSRTLSVPVRTDRWILVALLLLAFGLRVFNLGTLELSFDEAISANVASLGLEGALAHLSSQPFEHPPAYYLMLNPWLRLAGDSEFALRFFSVFWGTLTVPLLYLLVTRLTNRHLAHIAALLAAISPFLVAYSQEARMYTLLPCLSLAALLCYFEALENPRRPGWWLAYAAFIVLGFVTHYYFVFLWVVASVHLVLEKPRHRSAWLLGGGVQALALLGGAAWLLGSPGPRASLARVVQGETAFSLSYKLDKVLPTLMVSEVRIAPIPLATYLLAALGWLLTLLGIAYARTSRRLGPGSWRFLLLLLSLPIALSLAIPYGVLGRHLGYVLVAVFAFMALALHKLARRHWATLAAGLVAVLALNTYGLAAQYTASKGDFGQAMGYVNQQARDGDILVLTQPAQSPLVDHYNRLDWPVVYVPSGDAPATPSRVEEVMSEVAGQHTRLWLGPIGAWTADPGALVERWLSANAYQAEKTWFPESSSVALYLTAAKGLSPVQVGNLAWSGGIHLENASAGPLVLPVGDAVRLRLNWRSEASLGARYALGVALVDPDGRIWAERRSEPCGGWCPTDQWEPGEVHEDRHALLIPPGTPPGTYRVQLAWTPLAGGAPLATLPTGDMGEDASIARVTVLRPWDPVPVPQPAPNPLSATFAGEVTLVGYSPADAEVRAGETLHLETFWLAETVPQSDYALSVSLVDKWGQQAASWPLSPSASFFPTSWWQPGDYLRGQHDLPLPTSLPAGRYWLRFGLRAQNGEPLGVSGDVPRSAHRSADGQDLSLVSVSVVDRWRQFDLPAVGQAADLTFGQQAHLVGYDLDDSLAFPGGSLSLTLYWQAKGPMVRPFKVFAHLVGPDGRPLAQHDDSPGGGCCPTNTWVEGEIIIDHHPISIGASLVPGTYRLIVGLYDEMLNTRLPVFEPGGSQLSEDYFEVGLVSLGLPPTPPPLVRSGETKVYLPMVVGGDR